MNCYLSIVLCGRNDNYGENYLARLQTCLDSVDFLSAAYNVPVQVVFVEWNPPKERKTMRDAVRWGSFVQTKIVEVTDEASGCLPFAEGNSSLHEFIAKNVGIRHADGEFVLCCNSDLIFSPVLFEFFSRRELKTDAMYRTLRVDISQLRRMGHATYQDLLAECLANTFQANFLSGTSPLDGRVLSELIAANSQSSFGHDHLLIHSLGLQRNGAPLRIEADVLRAFPHLVFTNASGDFTLLSKEAWLGLRGYLETACRNHVDAAFCFEAAKFGVAQVLLPLSMLVFHQRHESAPLRDYFTTLAALSKEQKSDNWGLSGEKLAVENVKAEPVTGPVARWLGKEGKAVGEYLELAITDFCNLKCPLCSQGTPLQKNKQRMKMEDIEGYAEQIRPFEFSTIKISGGEPTMHPQFAELCGKLRDLFPSYRYEMATNGARLEEGAAAAKVFDKIDLSFYPGQNEQHFDKLAKLPLTNLNIATKRDYVEMEDVHQERNLGKKNIYQRCPFRMVKKVVQGRIYPCCIVFGQCIRQNKDPKEASVPLSNSWREEIDKIDMEPYCQHCYVDVK